MSFVDCGDSDFSWTSRSCPYLIGTITNSLSDLRWLIGVVKNLNEGVTGAEIKRFRQAFDSDPSARVAQNAISNTTLTSLALTGPLVST